MMFPKIKPWRSEKHRRNVAGLHCINCGVQGRTQAAHANFNKGMGTKACDSQLMALCVDCHRFHDSGGLFTNKAERWAAEAVLVDLTRAELISRSLWTPDVEAAYRIAYEPLKRAASINQKTNPAQVGTCPGLSSH